MSPSQSQRLYFIDYLRSFLVFIVVIDHVMQAYAQRTGTLFSWFVVDGDRTPFFDGLHLVIDSVHMAFFFLLAGMFVLPSVQRRGYGNFLKERLIKLGLPFVLGIALLVPPQTYFKYLEKKGDIGYWDYVWNVFFKVDWYYASALDMEYPKFTGDLSPSGFWFLGFLLIFTSLILFFRRFMPFVIRGMGASTTWLMEKPLRGYISISLLSFLLISLFEIFYGDRFWLGWSVFSCRGNLFPTYVLFFSLGVGLREAGYLGRSDWLNQLSKNWVLWLGYTIVLSGLYIGYCLTYTHDGAYTLEILRHFYFGGDWSNAWSVIGQYGPGTWVRTFMHGFLYTALTLTTVAIFHRFLNKENKFWMMMTASAYGIYIFHEPLCAWMAHGMLDSSLPPILKFSIVGIGGYWITWILVDKIMLKIPMIRRVISGG